MCRNAFNIIPLSHPLSNSVSLLFLGNIMIHKCKFLESSTVFCVVDYNSSVISFAGLNYKNSNLCNVKNTPIV